MTTGASGVMQQTIEITCWSHVQQFDNRSQFDNQSLRLLLFLFCCLFLRRVQHLTVHAVLAIQKHLSCSSVQ
jgi:hypothetical protein